MDVRTDPHGVPRISKVVAVIVGHAVLLEMLASASQKVVLDRGFDVEAFRILCFFVVFLGKDGTERRPTRLSVLSWFTVAPFFVV